MNEPYVLEETENFAVVFKPAKMHSESLGNENDTNIFNWYLKYSDFNKYIRLMHRLDYETNGLVLFAKNEKSFLFFKDLQDKDEFIKEYSAVCVPSNGSFGLDGFPNFDSVILAPLRLCENSFEIKSYFRPFGPGRKQVRPVIDDGKKHKEIAKDKGGFYSTEIISKNDNIFTLRIKRGFRHQIRCHLCWAGVPILNDPLYSLCAEPALSGELALRSHALFFKDPVTGEQREFRIEALGTILTKN